MFLILRFTLLLYTIILTSITKIIINNNNNNNNNNRFLYSAFPNDDQSASQCIITPVIGFRHNSALRVHFLHSLGSIPASRRFTGAHMPTQPQFRSNQISGLDPITELLIYSLKGSPKFNNHSFNLHDGL